MATEQSSKEAAPTSPASLEDYLEKNAGRVTLALFIAAALFATLPLYNLIQYLAKSEWRSPIFTVWGLAMALLAVWAGLSLKYREQLYRQSSFTPGEILRILIMVTGGLAGLLTFSLGLILPFSDWRERILPTISNREVPIIQLWKDNLWHIMVCQLAFLGGLVLMFVSVRLARTTERSHVTMRRLLHGYNAVQTGMLLLAILIMVNVLTYVPIPPFSWLGQTVDWTPEQLYTLQPASIRLVRGLKKPVHVYLVLEKETQDTPRVVSDGRQDLERLLENCRRYNPEIVVEKVLKNNPDEWKSFLDRFKRMNDDFYVGDTFVGGAVVTYGGGEDAPAELIRLADIIQIERGKPGSGQNARFIFQGEQALISSLKRLEEGGKVKIYFSQGNDEPSIQELPRRSPLWAEGFFEMCQELEAPGVFEVKSIDLNKVEKVPDDAAVLVLANPSTPYSIDNLQLIRDYLRRTDPIPGKVVVLLDVASPKGAGATGQMLQTGLEPLLENYGVEASDKRLLTNFPDEALENRVDKLTPDVVLGTVPRESRHPLALAFQTPGQPLLFRFDKARVVRPKADQPRAPKKHIVEPVLVSWEYFPVWEDSDLTTPGSVLLLSQLRNRLAFRARQQRALPLAVAVSDMPDSPSRTTGAPRMVVVGDTTWLSNQHLSQFPTKSVTDLFSSQLSWLRERSDLGVQVPPTERRSFTLYQKVPAEDQNNLFLLPLGLMLITVLGLGGGIWIMRRR